MHKKIFGFNMSSADLTAQRSLLWKRIWFIFIMVMLVADLGLFSASPVSAAPALTITPITWNVIGLDSNNVTVGPDTFPVGARVCNTGSGVLQGLVATFKWDSENPYINLRSGSLETITLDSLGGGSEITPSCFDFYFEVTVTRDSDAYEQSRGFHIEVSSANTSTPEFSTLSTPTPRELFVEYLISQNRNSTNMVSYALDAGPGTVLTEVPAGGVMSLMVGNTYRIKLDASTATQGYNQLEAFINFPNTIFQVLSVESYYTADTSAYVANESDKLYADACLWDMDPTSDTYLSCIGSDGKVGGTISTTYVVKIISVGNGAQTLNTLIYDFSGSSFHYNSDYSSSSRVFVVSSGLSMDKAFSPAAIAAGGTSTLSVSITNTSDTEVSNVEMIDNLPSGVLVAATPAASTDSGCTNFPTVWTSSGADFIRYTGGVAANSTCTISVDVTAAVDGTYVNVTEPLLVNDSDTGITATANLRVEDQPSGVCTPVTIAQWTIPDATLPPAATTDLTLGSALAYTNGSNTVNSGFWRITDSSVDSDGLDVVFDPTTDKYFRFQLDTSAYTDIKLSFNYIKGSAGSRFLDVYYGNSSVITPPSNPVLLPGAQFTPLESSQSSGQLDFTDLANTSGNTYFFLYVYAAPNSGGNAWVGVDEITVTGCTADLSQTMDKVFAPNPVVTGASSTLTFTLKNYTDTDATNVSFTDTFPAGMTIASPNNLSSDCGGTVTATAGTSSLTLSGGTIPQKTSGEFETCTIAVDVVTTQAGAFPNTSGYLSVGGTVKNSVATDTLFVVDPPVISKEFLPNPIYAGETSTLTFTITNPNPDTALTGVQFTDNFPAGMTVDSEPLGAQCGGTVSHDTDTVSLVGGSISAGSSCTVSVDVTASLVGDYLNTSGNVSSANGGTGNTASDTLIVQDVHPGIAIKKEASTSPTGPWAEYVYVAPGEPIYYRLIVENIGDVPLTSISITDSTTPENTTVETALEGCQWPAVLPVASSTQDPTATCVKGPFATTADTGVNTATAHGTYNETVYHSAPASATYAVVDLVLTKESDVDRFNLAGDTVEYTYTITNVGGTLQGPLTVELIDSVLPVACSVDLTTIEAGHDDNGAFENGEYFTCTAAYMVTAFDVAVGSVTNTAYALVTPFEALEAERTNMDRVTVFSNKPDLLVTKTNDVGGYATDNNPFTWTLTVLNQGPQNAVFPISSLVLRDALPSGPDYQLTTTTPSEVSGLSCALDSSNVLTCNTTTSGVTIPASGGYFTVEVEVTPTTTLPLINIATVDPDEAVFEGDEGNNNGSDALNVLADPTLYADLTVTKSDGITEIDAAADAETTYTITVTNNGPDSVTGAVLRDTLGIGLSASSVSCSAVSNNLCLSDPTLADLVGANGIILPTLSPERFYVISLVVDVTATSGSVTNTVLATLPDGYNDETPSDNTASDTDTINPVSDLAVTKTNGDTSVVTGTETTYTIRVTNNGPSSVTGAELKDTLGSGLSATDVSCSTAVGNKCVSAPALADLIGVNGISLPTLASGDFYEILVTADVTATSGTVTNTVTVDLPEGTTTDPNPENNTAVDTDSVTLPSADLVVTKENGSSLLLRNGSTTYTIRVTNTGPSSVSGAVLQDVLGAGLDVTSAICSTAANNQCVTSPNLADLLSTGITLPTLANGQFYEIRLAATVTAETGTVTNGAVVTMPEGIVDPTPENNSDDDQDSVINEYKLYLPFVSRPNIPVTETWNGSVGYEDLPLAVGNDYDYNDWLVHIATSYTFTSAQKETINQISFDFTPQARGATYEHRFLMNFPVGIFERAAVVTIHIYDANHNLIETRVESFDPSVENTYLIFENTADALPRMSNVVESRELVAPQRYADMTFAFVSPTPLNFDANPVYEAHGANLFFKPSLFVIGSGQTITTGDIRTLFVPVDEWAWPEEKIRIDLAYPLVTYVTTPSVDFLFPDQWWTQPNSCVIDGLTCTKTAADPVYID